jgi:hypothetical protein
MILKSGAKLRSAVSDVQIVIVRAPSIEIGLDCGGVPMLCAGETAPAGVIMDPTLAGTALIGKRYSDELIGLEVLCSKAGEGTLTCNGAPLVSKGAKPLPASD